MSSQCEWLGMIASINSDSVKFFFGGGMWKRRLKLVVAIFNILLTPRTK